MMTSWCSASSNRLATLIIHGPCLVVRGYGLPRMASMGPAAAGDAPTEPNASSKAQRARLNIQHERYRTTDSILKVSELVNDDLARGQLCRGRKRRLESREVNRGREFSSKPESSPERFGGPKCDQSRL